MMKMGPKTIWYMVSYEVTGSGGYGESVDFCQCPVASGKWQVAVYVRQ